MEPERPTQSDPQQKPGKSYGKRPAWQWVVIYLVIAIVVYGIIYLVFFRHSGGNGAYKY